MADLVITDSDGIASSLNLIRIQNVARQKKHRSKSKLNVIKESEIQDQVISENGENENIENNEFESEEVKENDFGQKVTDSEYKFCPFRDQTIFDGSTISIKDFAIAFVCVSNKLQLSEQATQTLLEFIRAVLPSLNNIPSALSKLLSGLNIDKPEEVRICSVCNQETNKAKCENRKCESNSLTNKTIQCVENVIIFDIERQLREVLKREWNNFATYKSK
jgi:hypothetical protein